MTDDELNMHVALDVMKWKPIDRVRAGWGDGPQVWATGCERSPTFQGFNPAGDIAHAFMAVNAADSFRLTLAQRDFGWQATFARRGETRIGNGDTPARAICAALVRGNWVTVSIPGPQSRPGRER